MVETQRYNHAREEVARLPLATLQDLDGIVAVGGDGLFQEVLNGALAIRCPWWLLCIVLKMFARCLTLAAALR